MECAPGYNAITRTLQGFRNKGTFYKKYKLRTCSKNDVSLFICNFFCYKTYLQIDSHLYLALPIKDRRGKLLRPSISVQTRHTLSGLSFNQTRSQDAY